MTDPGPPPPAAQPGAARHLAAIADGLAGHGITSRLTRIGGTPVLTISEPAAGPDHATITIDPGPGHHLDCTCIWTPAPGTTPQATAATIRTVLNALRPGPMTGPAENTIFDPNEPRCVPPAPRPAAAMPAAR